MLTRLYVKGQMLLNDLKNDQRGVTAIEYAIVAVAVAGIVTAVFSTNDGSGLQDALEGAFENLTNQLSEASE